MSCTSTIVGRLTRDPQPKKAFDGQQITALAVAVKQTSKKVQGEWVDRPAWYVDAEIWGKGAQVALDKLSKGDTVLISGQLMKDGWTDQATGEEREKFVMSKIVWELLQKKDSRPAPAQQHQQQQALGAQHYAAAKAPAPVAAPAVTDGEIPF